MADEQLPDELPPPSFQSLIQMLAGQAAHAMGVLPGPDGKSEVRLTLAKHFIDMLAILEEKTKSNLTGHEHRGLEQALHELRMIYVEASKKAPDEK
jgi:hypothetical protein